ncbi:DUF397 domain-containing protein [Streptomyces sp. Vc74B-19]|uniref:DUF397 domain-containing protein n=1 Tax=unclassified Streptomyces TaxID=2593676 RepID=UPI001BFC06C8|nr:MULTISPECIES: DUF397 domain-containing protein [unclassified Streptomyces]MBT3161898.1 DUF397 domain-containing protein [Streptomyces sp. Vc74B-19]
MTALSQLTWITSSYSGGSGTECVECAHTNTGTLIRDSKCADGPVVSVGADPWNAFVRSLRRGVPSA